MMQKFLFIWQNFFFENIVFTLKQNLHRVLGVVILLIGFIFAVTYGIAQYSDKKQRIVASYVSGANYLAQKDSVLALRYFQYVYNKSNGMMEMLSLMNIIDILLEDKQYDKVFDIITDAISQKQKPELAIMLYSKMINTIYILQDKKFDSSKIVELAHNIQKKAEMLSVSGTLLPHKNTIMLELNSITKFRPQEYYISRVNEVQQSNAMQGVLLEIRNNYK